MYTLKQLQEEIDAKIIQAIESNGTVSPIWITQEVMADHPDFSGDDADFRLCCSRTTVRKEATQQVNKIDKIGQKDGDSSAQLILEGFQHMHRVYVFGAGENALGIPTEVASDEQLEGKAKEYAAMGAACLDHADEIRRYIQLRREAKKQTGS